MVRRFGLMLVTLFGISGHHLRAAPADPGQHCRHSVRCRGVRRSGRQGADQNPISGWTEVTDPGAIRRLDRWAVARRSPGYSYQTERPAIEEILPRIPITARLAGLALTFAVVIGVPLGVLSAVRQDTWLDYTLRVLSLSGLALPAFWLGLLILMAFVSWFGTIPIYSSDNPPGGSGNETLLMYSVPAAAVGFRSSAFLTRITRSSMLEVLRQDYIRTARSKGASEMTINYNHALKNAMLPVVTVIGLEAGILLGGLIVSLETVSSDYSRRCALPCRSGALARLSDGSKPRDVHRDRRRLDQFHRRHAVRSLGSAHQIR